MEPTCCIINCVFITSLLPTATPSGVFGKEAPFFPLCHFAAHLLSQLQQTRVCRDLLSTLGVGPQVWNESDPWGGDFPDGWSCSFSLKQDRWKWILQLLRFLFPSPGLWVWRHVPVSSPVWISHHYCDNSRSFWRNTATSTTTSTSTMQPRCCQLSGRASKNQTFPSNWFNLSMFLRGVCLFWLWFPPRVHE